MISSLVGWLLGSGSAVGLAAAVAACAAAGLYYFATCTHDKWRRLNVPHEPPAPLFGNTYRMTAGLEHQLETFDRAYRRFPGARYCGLYQFRTPFLMVRDPELVNRVMVKDFGCFANRGLDFDPAVNLLARSMFFAADRPWRTMRQKLSPGFTSGKLKGMHGQIKECSDRLMRRLGQRSAAGPDGAVDVKGIVGDFTNDVIGACAFGLQLNTVDADDGERSAQVFRDNVKKLFGTGGDGDGDGGGGGGGGGGGYRRFLVQTLLAVFPRLASLLRVQAFSVEATDFFHAMFSDVIRYRTENNVYRTDLTQTLMDARRDLVVDGDDDPKSTADEYKFTELDIIANAILLFVAGSNTVSATMSFCLYELALNKSIQDRLRAEIYSTKEKHGGQLTPEFLMGLHYADMVLDETHRKYSITIIIPREANQDYQVPDDPLVIKKGDKLLIPMYSLHHDPKYYPNPDTFDPERFTPEEKSKRPNGTFLPFGDGPRHCIGKRFAGMELKLVLTEILSKYEVLPCEKTEVPIQYTISPGFITAKNGIWLTFKPIVN